MDAASPPRKAGDGLTLTVLLFAKLRELAGTDRVSVTVPDGATVSLLKQELGKRFPAAMTLLERSVIAVNHEFAAEERVLTEADEIAVIPPVSGG